jgi:hypothetical protein
MVMPTVQAEGEAEKERRRREYKEELDKQVREKRVMQQQQGMSPYSAKGTPVGYEGSPRYLGAEANVGVMRKQGSPDLRRASGCVSTMHWGEREVEQWHEQQARMKQHKDDLERQIREKAVRRSDYQASHYTHAHTHVYI